MTDYNLFANDGIDPTFNLKPSNSGVAISGSDLTATASQLLFNFDNPGLFLIEPPGVFPLFCFQGAGTGNCALGPGGANLAEIAYGVRSFTSVNVTGTQVITSGSFVQAAPEPATAMLVCLAAILAAFARRSAISARCGNIS